MPKVHTVQKARKDHPPDIKKGDTYYHWKFRYGGLWRSKTYPKPWQLTQSPFLQQLYQLQEYQFDPEDLEASRDDLVNQIQELLDECQESLDNMPKHLQDSSSSGELLQERIDGLESWISDLENVDLEAEMALEDLEACDCPL